MKKTILFSILLFLIVVAFPIFIRAGENPDDILRSCISSQGWTVDEFLYPHGLSDIPKDKDPVEYFDEYIAILDCISRELNQSGFFWGHIGQVANFGYKIGFNMISCYEQGESESDCSNKDRICSENCEAIYGSISGDNWELRRKCGIECYDALKLCEEKVWSGCENEFKRFLRAKVAELKSEKPKEEDPKIDLPKDLGEKICEPNEKKCVDDYLWQCKSDGLSWESTKCFLGCDPDASKCIEQEDLSITVSPDKVRLLADGKSSQEFIIKAKAGDNPLKGEKFTISIWTPFSENAISDFGKTNVKTVTTDSSGKASFLYTAPMAPEGVYFKNFNFQIRVIGTKGEKIDIALIDPKPRVVIKFSEKSILEGTSPGINYADVSIIDEFGKEWDIKIESNLGRLAPQGRSGGFYTLLDKAQGKDYKFNWLPPEGSAELVDATMNYVIAHQKDWSKFKTGIKEDSVNFALSEIFSEKPKAMKEFESWKDFYENSKADVEDLQEYVRQIKTSTSAYERFLRSMSMGFRGLQVFHGTKGFMEDKLGDPDEKSSFKEYLEGIRDKTIHYGIDSLRSGLNHWADLVREGSLDTRKVPVSVTVEVTNDLGFRAKKSEVFQYIYYTLEK